MTQPATPSQHRRPTADLRPASPPPELDDPAADDDHPHPWDWAHLADTDAACSAENLAAFVEYFNRRYPWTRDQTIPPCWAQHGALIEEIVTLMWSRWAAFEGPLANPDSAQAWHTYHLPLFIARITTAIGPEAAADCRAGHHQPSRLVDPDRPHNTGHQPAPPQQ